MKIVNKGLIGRLFCKHEYQWFKKPQTSTFAVISGEYRIRVCPKCGKQKGEMFAEYEGKGFR